MKVSFAPLRPDAIALLSWAIEVDYSPADFTSQRWLCVTARRDDDRLMGVAVFELKDWFEAMFSTAIVDPRCMSRKLLRVMFSSIFRQVVRVSAEIDPGNELALRQVHRLGFIHEGFKRAGLDGRRDALLFGMLRDDCRFLTGLAPGQVFVPLDGGRHGQGATAS